ncbi:uncharacterized protein [Periplaneta americana]|uniref:uncharacterized protein isoform X1 n=1 Tax=Periplaneta americana TaxID=6978 RepID=UPI0037E8C2CB
MKLLRSLLFLSVGLVFSTLNNGCLAYIIYGGFNNPIVDDYLLDDLDSTEEDGLEFTNCDGNDCLNFDSSDMKVDGIIVDFGINKNCTSDLDGDQNVMPNDVTTLTTSSRDANVNRNSADVEEFTDVNVDDNSVSESDILDLNIFDDGHEFVDPEGDIEAVIVDDITYADMPGILIIGFVNDEGIAGNSREDNSIEITSAELALNVNKAVEALTELLNSDDSASEDQEWMDEPSEPHNVVEGGYIFYDMGSEE